MRFLRGNKAMAGLGSTRTWPEPGKPAKNSGIINGMFATGLDFWPKQKFGESKIKISSKSTINFIIAFIVTT